MDIFVLSLLVTGLAGGVHNGWEYGLTYRLKDGKKMEIRMFSPEVTMR